jgi:hypothetical protein
MTPKGTVLPGIRESSYCSVRFDDDEEGSLRVRISSALAVLAQYHTILEQLRSSGGRISLFIGWFCSGQSGESLDHALLGTMARLGISMDLNIYCGDDEEEE